MPQKPDELLKIVEPVVREIAGATGPLQLTTLPGGASLRRYHRVTTGGRPPTLVVMELAEERLRSEEATKETTVKELPFVNVLRYLEQGGVAVPHLHRYDEAEGLLYLEDLGDATFESRVQGQPLETQRRYYGMAIRDLVKMQRYAASHAGECIAFERGFDRDLLRWELDHFREWGLDASGVRLTDGERAALDDLFDRIAGELAAAPRGFVHRDYQSRNLMVEDTASGPRLRLIDFQDALLGTRAYDLVALLRDSYVLLPDGLVAELVDLYAAEAEVDPAAFRRLFDLQTVQRKLKDAGRFVFIDRVKKNPSFLPYIASSQGYAAAALARLPEWAGLREILARHLTVFR